MDKPKVSVEGFSMEWPHLTKKQQEENPMMYKYALNYIKSTKATEGFKAKRICKPTSKGTKISFERFKNQDDLGEYCHNLNQEFDEIVENIPELKAAVEAARRENLKAEIVADRGMHCTED